MKLVDGSDSVKLIRAVSPAASWVLSLLTAIVGATVSIGAPTRSPKFADATALPSLADTFTSSAPVSVLAGVPLKVRVSALKLSHAGSAAPLASAAR